MSELETKAGVSNVGSAFEDFMRVRSLQGDER